VISSKPHSTRPETSAADHTAVDGDAGAAFEAVLAVLAWAKANDVELTAVSVGPAGCSVTLARPIPAPDRNAPPVDPRQAMYRQFGGKLFERAIDDEAIDEHGNVPAVR
jgi:hypothetical protein